MVTRLGPDLHAFYGPAVAGLIGPARRGFAWAALIRYADGAHLTPADATRRAFLLLSARGF